MNKAEVIEAMKNKYVYWQNTVGIINAIQPTTEEAWEVIKKEYDIETAEYLKDDLDKLVKYESLNLKIDLEELVEHVIVNGLAKPQKVVIPEFVAEWWEWSTVSDGLFDYILKYRWNECAAYDDFIPSNVLDWMFDSDDSIVLALRLITGELDYEVEKEKLYCVVLPEEIDSRNIRVLKKYPNGEINIGLIRKSELKTATRIRFTEQQIKAIDERYWAFAVEVEDAE